MPCRMDDEGGPVTMSYGRRESFVLADDMTDFFGSQRSVDGKSVVLMHCTETYNCFWGLTLQRLFDMPLQYPK